MSEILKHKIRKELNRWSRKLLLTIGLESIGRQLVGEGKWEQIYPLQQVWLQESASDFDPTEEVSEEPEDISQIEPSDTTEEDTNEEKNDILENIFQFLPYWYFINRAFGVPGVGPENTIPEELNRFNLNNNGMLEMLDAQRLLFLQSLENQQQLARQNLSPTEAALQNATTSKFYLESNCNVNIPDSLIVSASISDEPLDLTKKNKNNTEDKMTPDNYSTFAAAANGNDLTENGTRNGVGRVASSSTNRIVTRVNQRAGRGYTTEELEAALKDIQSGKLGTRRAAVIYGIPRSTLRNKVYKLGKDRAFIRQVGGRKRLDVIGNTSNLSHTGRNIEEQALDDQEDLRSLETSNPGISANLTSTPYLSPFYSHPEEYESMNHDDDESGEGMSPQKKVLKEWLRSKLSRQGFSSETSLNENVESFLPNAASGNTSLTNMYLNESSEDGNNSDTSNGPHDVILKIPSLLSKAIPTRQSLRRRRNGNSHSLNMRVASDRAGRVSNWKNRKSDDAPYASPYDCDSEADSTNGVHSNGVDRSERLRHEVSAAADRHSIKSTAADSDEKKSRPKRGKYRNYDRDALLKAVKAVQNGEMSVHRAGSFFGVPHSTLEYKVKERHLLRRPKRKGVESPKSTQRSSPDSSLSGSELPSNHEEPSENHTGDGSNSLPLPSDLRESLSRYLNLNASIGALSSSPSSPETPINSTDHNVAAMKNRINEHQDSGHIRATDSAVFNIINKFSKLHETNNLLDLSKKF